MINFVNIVSVWLASSILDYLVPTEHRLTALHTCLETLLYTNRWYLFLEYVLHTIMHTSECHTINTRLNIYLHHNYNSLLIVNRTSSETYVVNNNMYKRSTPQKNMIPKIPFCKNIMTYRRYSYNIAAYQKFIHKNVVLFHFCNMM